MFRWRCWHGAFFTVTQQIETLEGVAGPQGGSVSSDTTWRSSYSFHQWRSQMETELQLWHVHTSCSYFITTWPVFQKHWGILWPCFPPSGERDLSDSAEPGNSHQALLRLSAASLHTLRPEWFKESGVVRPLFHSLNAPLTHFLLSRCM